VEENRSRYRITGLLAALYRLRFDGWSAQRAIAEMEGHHFGVRDRSAMKEYVERFPTSTGFSREAGRG